MIRTAVVLVVLAWLAGCDSDKSAPPSETPPAAEVPEMAGIIWNLGSPVPEVRFDALMKLRRMGAGAEPALDAVVPILDDPSLREMAPAALVIGSMARDGSNKALEVLVAGLAHPSRRRGAVSGLEIAGPVAREATPALAALVDDPDERVRVFTVRALASIGGEVAVAALAGLVGVRDQDLRAEVCWGLSRFERLNDEVIEKLKVAAQDPDPDVAAAAAFSIWKSGGAPESAVVALARALDDELRSAQEPLEALAEMGPLAAAAVDHVLPLLKVENTQTQGSAARTLGSLKVGTPEVVDALIVVVGKEEVDCSPQTSAVLALAELGPAAVPAAKAVALHLDSHPGIALFAENTLLNMGPGCIPALQAMLKDDQVPPALKGKIQKAIVVVRDMGRRDSGN